MYIVIVVRGWGWDEWYCVSQATQSEPSFPPQQVHAAAMSSAMRTHNLMAVGTDDRRVRLCDLKSGGAWGYLNECITCLSN